MDDKKFDKLLSDSVKTYGHEYYKETADTKDNVPPHSFPDGFISDIVPEKKTKKSVWIIRLAAAAAAVFVIGMAVVLAPLIIGTGWKTESGTPLMSEKADTDAAESGNSDNTKSVVSDNTHYEEQAPATNDVTSKPEGTDEASSDDTPHENDITSKSENRSDVSSDNQPVYENKNAHGHIKNYEVFCKGSKKELSETQKALLLNLTEKVIASEDVTDTALELSYAETVKNNGTYICLEFEDNTMISGQKVSKIEFTVTDETFMICGGNVYLMTKEQEDELNGIISEISAQ